MIKVFKSRETQIFYIETVAQGHVEDFQHTRAGEFFTIDRINTNIIEVDKAHYSIFEGVNHTDGSAVTFVNADEFETYLTIELEHAIIDQQINEDMSVITVGKNNGIVTIDARNSTTNNIVTGGVSGKHSYIFSGLFHKPKLNGATTPLTLNAGSNAVVVNGVGEKEIAGNTWNSYLYSTESFNPLEENFAYSWLVESVDGTIREMAGFDNMPTQNQTYSSIEYAIYQVNNYFYSYVYEKGKSVKIPNYTTFYLQVGDRMGVMCINQKVSYFVLRNGVITIIYTSEELATEPLFFKAAFNRGVGSSGESKLGDVVFHSETEIDSFFVSVEGNSTDIVSEEHRVNLKSKAGLDLLSGVTYSLLEFNRLDVAKFKTADVLNDIDIAHEYRSLANQTTNKITF